MRFIELTDMQTKLRVLIEVNQIYSVEEMASGGHRYTLINNTPFDEPYDDVTRLVRGLEPIEKPEVPF